MRIIYGFFFIVLLAFGISFAILNGDKVALDYFWGNIELPLSLLMIAVFVLGAVAGLFAGRFKGRKKTFKKSASVAVQTFSLPAKKKKNRKIIVGLFLLALSIASFITYYMVYDNHFFTVLPGQAYRSGQLSTQDFQTAIQKNHIQSVINLRGRSENKAWYLDEMAAMQATGIQHYDINLSAHALPSPSELKKLVEVLQTAPRPLLIHCRRGIDRTGFAAAVLLILNDQASLPKAEEQYSYRYLRFNLTSTGPLVMAYYEAWLQHNKWVSSRDHFIAWVNLVAANNSYELGSKS